MGELRGWQAAGKAQQQANHRFFINNGRANMNWQNWFLDQGNELSLIHILSRTTLWEKMQKLGL